MTGLLAKLVALARASIADCEGGALVEAALANRSGSREVAVAGAGKAVDAMATGALRALGARMRCGPLVGKYPAPALDKKLQMCLRIAGHPIPDERGERAAAELLAFAGALAATDEALLLLSGGASSLLAAPIDGLALAELAALTRALIASGEPIHAINAVRRHLGRALGGRLALATRARLEVLALSDVAGDDPATIGSGPAAADPTTFADALAVLDRIGWRGPARDLLERGARGELPETPKPGDPRLARVRHRVLATPETLRARAIARAREAGLAPVEEPRLVEGDVAEVARAYAERARSLAAGEVLIAVGEPTVRVRGAGLGGRAQQLSLEVALRLAGTGAAFVALGSDGSDGPTDAAGAAIDGDTIDRMRAAGIDPARVLDDNDAHPALAAAAALLRTGPTGTNLLDLHLLAVAASRR